MIFAYADPPYIGQASRHYAADPNCAEVDHAALIARLELEFPDGWALSCKSNAKELAWLIGLCTREIRIGAWLKPFCSFKPNVTIAYAWEPVLICGGRPRARTQPTVRDWIEAPAVKESITLKRGLSGVKPQRFSFWLFEVWNARPGDELVDLFPGSNAVSQAWEAYMKRFTEQQSLLTA